MASLIEDFILENQRRVTMLSGETIVSGMLHMDLDSQYGKQHLKTTDPSAWVTLEFTSCTPTHVPFVNGYVTFKPWVYVVDTPNTDASGWIYKKSFTDADAHNQNSMSCEIRYRKWKRVSCKKEDFDRLLEEEEKGIVHTVNPSATSTSTNAGSSVNNPTPVTVFTSPASSTTATTASSTTTTTAKSNGNNTSTTTNAQPTAASSANHDKTTAAKDDKWYPGKFIQKGIHQLTK